MGGDGLAGETDPSKGIPTASSACMPPLGYHSFRALKSNPGFLSSHPLTPSSSEEETLDISVQRISVLPPGVPESYSIPDTGEPVGRTFPPPLKIQTRHFGQALHWDRKAETHLSI